jgi:hypothetical protein
MGQRIVLEGDASLLCSALELAEERYAGDAVRAHEWPRIQAQFKRQAEGVRELLVQAYAARDG